ncbi:HNH endonuclease [Pseudomonas sp. PDM23]|uniref:HNH endonuclease n=1 Tax=unclassified Pseudomonas TaxID=196821 RepID=UPI001781C032|nr:MULTISPECIES: HNH endonuclease [unclassified Pseudomonas]MBD9573687.1 HNH endonuclease [Pseudomonas sp. PDM23]MBD9675038.1 HNH endonuclease [Pseudomonas sp. PDM21]
MISITAAALDKRAVDRLQGLQDDVNNLPDYAAQVDYAKSSWSKKPSSLFDGLKLILADMCSGNRRCVYCEDSFADEIEHMRPKDLYPEQAYVWSNYVLACGPCNGPKNNQFAVLTDPLALIDVTRKRNAPVIQPLAGRPALIDPRVESPVDFLWLDFRTWRYVPNSDDETSEIWLRADYTINVLGLNKREALVRGRKSAFSGFSSRLTTWLERREHWSPEEQQDFLDDFRVERYRGVWERMKLYRDQVPALHDVAQLIQAAPEALQW